MSTFHFAWDFLHVGVLTFHFVWYLPHFGMFTFHFAWDLLHVGVFPFYFAWDWPHLGMFTFHFAWDFLHMGVFTFHFAWHGIGCILACSPSFCMGFAACGRVHLPFCMGFAACWHVPLPFCMRFSTCEHVRHIIMPTPRDLIHFGMATSTTSSCHPQAFKRRLVRKNASCGRWSWLAFTPSCSPHHHANPN